MKIKHREFKIIKYGWTRGYVKQFGQKIQQGNKATKHVADYDVDNWL